MTTLLQHLGVHPQPDIDPTAVSLHWLRATLDPESSVDSETMQYLPMLLLLSIYDRKFTSEEYTKAVSIACSMQTCVVQGLLAEKMINFYGERKMECPALRERFASLAKDVKKYRVQAGELVERMIAMPKPEQKLN